MLSISIVILLYLFLWQRRLGDLMVSFLENCLGMTPEESFLVYHLHFREYKEVFLAAAMIVIFFLLLLLLFRWMTHYFKEINQGIDALLTEDDTAIQLSSEMHPFAHKLNTVKQTLKKQKEETALAEQRKNELVM